MLSQEDFLEVLASRFSPIMYSKIEEGLMVLSEESKDTLFSNTGIILSEAHDVAPSDLNDSIGTEIKKAFNDIIENVLGIFLESTVSVYDTISLYMDIMLVNNLDKAVKADLIEILNNDMSTDEEKVSYIATVNNEKTDLHYFEDILMVEPSFFKTINSFLNSDNIEEELMDLNILNMYKIESMAESKVEYRDSVIYNYIKNNNYENIELSKGLNTIKTFLVLVENAELDIELEILFLTSSSLSTLVEDIKENEELLKDLGKEDLRELTFNLQTAFGV